MDPIEPQRPVTTNTTVVTPRREEGSVGPVIATIIILAVIVLGGLYFWGARNNGDTVNDPNATYDADGNRVDGMSNSDDTSSIEADLNNTNVDDPDFEIQAS